MASEFSRVETSTPLFIAVTGHRTLSGEHPTGWPSRSRKR